MVWFVDEVCFVEFVDIGVESDGIELCALAVDPVCEVHEECVVLVEKFGEGVSPIL
jgi:hypothetical protein